MSIILLVTRAKRKKYYLSDSSRTALLEPYPKPQKLRWSFHFLISVRVSKAISNQNTRSLVILIRFTFDVVYHFVFHNERFKTSFAKLKIGLKLVFD